MNHVLSISCPIVCEWSLPKGNYSPNGFLLRFPVLWNESLLSPFIIPLPLWCWLNIGSRLVKWGTYSTSLLPTTMPGRVTLLLPPTLPPMWEPEAQGGVGWGPTEKGVWSPLPSHLPPPPPPPPLPPPSPPRHILTNPFTALLTKWRKPWREPGFLFFL